MYHIGLPLIQNLISLYCSLAHNLVEILHTLHIITKKRQLGRGAAILVQRKRAVFQKFLKRVIATLSRGIMNQASFYIILLLLILLLILRNKCVIRLMQILLGCLLRVILELLPLEVQVFCLILPVFELLLKVRHFRKEPIISIIVDCTPVGFESFV